MSYLPQYLPHKKNYYALTLGLAALLLLILWIFLVATHPVAQTDWRQRELRNPVYPTAGFYEIQVANGDKWQSAGKLSFNRLYTTKSLDLKKYDSSAGIKVRLIEKGR